MDKCPTQPSSKACDKNERKRKVFLKAQESNEEEKDTGQYAPNSPSGEILHDYRFALVLKIHPHENQGPGKRHDPDETGGRWQLSSDFCSNQYNGNAKDYFQ